MMRFNWRIAHDFSPAMWVGLTGVATIIGMSGGGVFSNIVGLASLILIGLLSIIETYARGEANDH